MTLAINEGVSLPTLKCLFQARGLKKIRQEHQRLIDWYFYFKKVVTFETAAELLWLESPEVLHDSIRTLQKLTTRSYLKPGNDYSQRY